MKLLLSAFLYLLVKIRGDDDSGWSLVGNPLVAAHPCNGSTDIKLMYEPGKSPEEENQYNLWIHKKFPKNTIIKLKFDKGATIKLSNKTFARIYLDKSRDHAFKIRFFESHEGIDFHVKGCSLGVVPYIQSVNINTKEYCQEPLMGFLDSYIEGYRDQVQSSCTTLQEHKAEININCGKRQTLSQSIRVSGESQRSDWPWHTALFKERRSKLQYLCGGTLISKHHVLTVAHCVSIGDGAVDPEKFFVLLGKHDVPQESEIGELEKNVEKIIIHENFIKENLDHDIALLKLKNEVTFTEFIQPACLWNENIHKKLSSPITGTIIGWGYDENQKMSNKLSQLQIQMIPDDVCRKTNPYYSRILNGNKFCGGNLEEAVACRGDSGGGFHVFIPDKVNDNSTSGAWYVRGIISQALPDEEGSCSNFHYTVFTDVAEHIKWIYSHI